MAGRLSLSFWLIAATIVMVVAVALSFRWLGSSPLGNSGSNALGGAIVLQGVELRGREASHPSWSVRASQMTLARDRRAGAITGLRDGVFYADGHPAVTFAADHLTYQDAVLGTEGGLELTGHIQVITQTPLASTPVTVETERARWRIGDHHLICPEPVRATIGSLGAVTTKTLMLDTQTHSVEAGPTLIVADAGAAPLATAMPATAATSKPFPGNPSNKVTFSAPEGGRWDDAAQTLTIPGPVTFRQGAATMTTSGAVYDRRTKIARSESPVTITDETSIVTGDHGTIDFGAHTATLTDNIKMTVKPQTPAKNQSDPDADVKQPTTLSCQQIVYDYRAKLAHTAGKVVIKQIDRTVTADSGQYNAKTQIANLTGNVVATTTDGKILRAPSAKISTVTGKEWVEVDGPISGELPDTEDLSTPTQSASAPKSPAKPAKP